MVTIVVGGFFGDEGKGKIVGYLATHDKPHIVVRAGSGPQAGHTVVSGLKVTQVPSGLINPRSRLLIARGTLINPEIFLKEVKENSLDGRIFVDRGCTIIEPHHIKEEQELVKRVGSVGTGVGPARVDRVLRRSKLAQDEPRLKKYLTDVAEEVNTAVTNKKNVLIEGVQGYGLSLLDHKYYPYVTSQDTTASQFAADTGIGPRMVDHVIVIFKAYISRVGPGKPDHDWSEKEKERRNIREHGTVSGRERRLSDFDPEMAAEAIIRNSSDISAITCVDRLFHGNGSVNNHKKLSGEAIRFIRDLEAKLKKKTKLFKGFQIISTGPDLNDIIDLRKHKNG